MFSKRIEELECKNAKRNQLYALGKKYAKEGNNKKVQNILKNNLGDTKKDNQTKKFKSQVENYINPAYTSQVCNKCGKLGIRDNDLFTYNHCGTMNVNINALINILNRKDDKEIKLTTSYKEVKNILENRLKTKNKKEEIISLI